MSIVEAIAERRKAAIAHAVTVAPRAKALAEHARQASAAARTASRALRIAQRARQHPLVSAPSTSTRPASYTRKNV